MVYRFIYRFQKNLLDKRFSQKAEPVECLIFRDIQGKKKRVWNLGIRPVNLLQTTGSPSPLSSASHSWHVFTSSFCLRCCKNMSPKNPKRQPKQHEAAASGDVRSDRGRSFCNLVPARLLLRRNSLLLHRGYVSSEFSASRHPFTPEEQPTRSNDSKCRRATGLRCSGPLSRDIYKYYIAEHLSEDI